MSHFEGDWTRDQAERFLDAAVIPVRIGCHRPGGGLWMLSLWYRYADGRIECATGRTADVVSFLETNGEVCFEISTNRPPYMGVRGSGTATVEDGGTDLLRSLIERYLGTTDTALARWLLREDREEVVIGIDPARVYTWDFTPRMRDLESCPAADGAPSSPTDGG